MNRLVLCVKGSEKKYNKTRLKDDEKSIICFRLISSQIYRFLIKNPRVVCVVRFL
jgi:hypothetical protein